MEHFSAQFIFLFLDGVGLAGLHPSNPFASNQAAPFLSELLGGPLLSWLWVNTPKLLFKPIDACLGMPGLPQSATGQTALYTGCNAPAFLGRHLSAFANGSLRTLIAESGMFKQVLALGGSVTHANFYPPAYFEAIAQRRSRYSVGTLLALTAGVPFRMTEDYDRGEAIYWDITGQRLSQRGVSTPAITPQEAGKRLADIGARHHLTLFECYLPDYAGHQQDRVQADRVIALIDAFIESIVADLLPQVTLVISSDHGNLEDLSSKRHTLNPVPLLVFGPQAAAFNTVTDIVGITPKMVELVASQATLTQ